MLASRASRSDLSGSRLADQYATARVDHGFGDAELAALARSSLAVSRAPSDVLARRFSDEPGGNMGAGVRVHEGTVLAPHGFSFFGTDPLGLGGVVAYRVPEG